jgi:hypothetical protein
MKYFLRISIVFITILLSFTIVKSQSLEFFGTPQSNVSGSPNDPQIVSDASVRNKSNDTIKIKVKMTVISIIPGQQVFFCLGVCYPPRTNDFEMPDIDAVSLAPGEYTTGLKFFDVALIPGGISGTSTVKITFFVLGNLSDSAEYTVTFSSTTSVTENTDLTELFAQPVPNPANDYILFNYNIPENLHTVNIEIYNSIGTLIDRIPLNNNETGIKYDAMKLPCGAYYSVLNIGGNKRAVKRFIISR